MQELLESKLNFLISRRLDKIRKLYFENTYNMQNDLEIALIELVSDKTDGSLVISFLRSSYILKSYEFYIAYYEGELFVEEEPDCVYFSMKRALRGIEEDWREMDEELHQNFIRVFAGEKEEIHRWYIEQLYIAMESIMKMAVEKMQKSRGVDVYYGGYMEEVKVIGSI